MIIFIFKCILIIALILTIGAIAFLNSAVFGGSPDSQTLQTMQKSPNYQNGKFENLQPLVVDGSGAGVSEDERLNLMDFIINIFHPADGKHPKESLPTLPLTKNIPLQNNSFTWLGHSTILFKMGDKTIITDPVFYRVSPIPLGGKPYSMTHLPKTDELPNLDIVILSHDHYDHLDMKAIQEIHLKAQKFLVPLGVKAHLVKWGVDKNKIQEFAWHDTQNLDGLEFIFVPSRHYGGRKLSTRSQTLWGGWVVKSVDFALYFTGDGGFGSHFADIAKTYAPDDGFDLMFVENGAYNVNWADVHMFPEQSVQAVKDAKAKLALPIHWGKYDLAYHKWDEPAERFLAEATKQNVAFITPKIGQNFTINDQTTPWWKEVQ